MNNIANAAVDRSGCLRAAAWLFLLLVGFFPALRGAERETMQSLTLKSLEQRRIQQVEADRAMGAFHAFQFVDRREASGIKFEHHIVPLNEKVHQVEQEF